MIICAQLKASERAREANHGNRECATACQVREINTVTAGKKMQRLYNIYLAVAGKYSAVAFFCPLFFESMLVSIARA